MGGEWHRIKKINVTQTIPASNICLQALPHVLASLHLSLPHRPATNMFKFPLPQPLASSRPASIAPQIQRVAINSTSILESSKRHRFEVKKKKSSVFSLSHKVLTDFSTPVRAVSYCKFSSTLFISDSADVWQNPIKQAVPGVEAA